MTKGGATARIGPEIVSTGIVRHQHDDVRPLLLRLRWLHVRRSDSQQRPKGYAAE
jgi:hypothetical protein